MKVREKESAANEKTDAHAEPLIDLPVSEDKADETKGGNDDYGYFRNRFGSTI